MLKGRKEYRKKYNAEGQLYLGGEILRLNCYDVSVKGAMVEIIPGTLLSTTADFQALLFEDRHAEIFIEDLMMSGEVIIAWAREARGRIMLGVEFIDVLPNAEKLWRKRRNYRKNKTFTAELFIDKDRLNIEGVNYSVEGACLKMAVNHPAIVKDALIKLHLKEMDWNAIGKVVWVKSEDNQVTVGLQMLVIQSP
jgi:hypothetical protein